jgi:quercetin dioxygenase-like cupin family protein
MQTTISAPKLLAPSEGEALRVLGETITIKVRGEETGGAYSMIETVAPPGGGPPLHVHHREDESFYVLEGEFEVRIADETLRVGPGAFLFAPRDIPHTYRNVGDSPGRFVAVISPPGFERFFKEVHELGQEGPPAREALLALARKYDLEFPP